MIIIQVTNKVLFTKKNLLDSNTVSVSTSQKNRSLMSIKSVFFFNFNIAKR